MSGVSSFLRNYEFLNLTKSVTESQMALYQKPNQTWAQVGDKFYNICWYNLEAISAVGADVVTYLAVSAMRKCGFFLPQPPQPPTFPIPHDNVEFVGYAIQRALWNWDPAQRKELEEGIADSLSEKWNVFQVVGEWSLAFSFENDKRSSFFRPTFLTVSEPLENGESYLSVGAAFERLRQRDKTAILNALYRQEAPASLSSTGKKVFQDIRSLASKLHQGNQGYLTTYSDYVKQIEANTSPAPEPLPETVVHAAEPSAPPQPQIYVSDGKMTADVSFFRASVMDAVARLDPTRRNRVVRMVVEDTTGSFERGYSPEILAAQMPESSPKYFIARLALLNFFKEGFQKNQLGNCPDCFSLDQHLRNRKTLREIGQDFAMLSNQDFAVLKAAIVDPYHARLNWTLQAKLSELSELAESIRTNDRFLRIYEALRIDLLAD